MAANLGAQLLELEARLRDVERRWNALSDQAKKLRETKAKFSRLVGECNTLVLALRTQVSPVCEGHQQGGPRDREVWGHWVRHEASSREGYLVDGQQVLLGVYPESFSRGWRVRLWWAKTKRTGNVRYLSFSPSSSCNYPLRVHRALWQDAFGIRLPSWIHVDHEFGDRGDCRLSSLQLLTQWENGAKGRLRSLTGDGVAGGGVGGRGGAAAAAAATATASSSPGAAMGSRAKARRLD